MAWPRSLQQLLPGRAVCLAIVPAVAFAAQAAPGPPRIITSVLPAWSLAVNVVGTVGQVENLLPPGVGPHDYQFSLRDLRNLRSADLVVINGLHLEDWISKALQENVLRKSPVFFEAAAGLENELIYSDAGSGRSKEPNPHIWLDPLLVARSVTNLLSALKQIDPARAAQYETNAAGFIARLHHLDEEIAGRLKPYRGRPLVTAHNAFPYFFRRYQLKQAGVIEEWPDIDPTPKRLKQISQVIRDERIKVIFTEPGVSSKLVRQLAKDLHIEVAELDTFETGRLTPNAYEDVMRQNVKTLETFLRK